MVLYKMFRQALSIIFVIKRSNTLLSNSKSTFNRQKLSLVFICLELNLFENFDLILSMQSLIK